MAAGDRTVADSNSYLGGTTKLPYLLPGTCKGINSCKVINSVSRRGSGEVSKNVVQRR